MNRLRNPALWIALGIAASAAVLHGGVVSEAVSAWLRIAQEVLGVAGALFFGAGLSPSAGKLPLPPPIVVLAFALLVPQVAHAQARVIAPGVALPDNAAVQQSAGAPVITGASGEVVNASADVSDGANAAPTHGSGAPPAAALDPRVPLDLAKLSAGLQATQTTLTSIMSQLGIKPTLPAGFCDAGAGKAVCVGFTVTGIVISALGAGVATYAAVK
jgi:hypothetical protein